MTPDTWLDLATSFVGRVREVAAVDALLAPGALVTVVGPAGCGKTRLAVELGKKPRWDEARWFVPLVAARDSDAVVTAIAESLGAGETPGATLLQAAEERLCGARGLLVVDNCEQVRASIANVVSRLRTAAPDLAILCTSRTPLGAPGEVVSWLEPLGVSGPGAEAVGLFRARARARSAGLVLEDEALLAKLCARLDGLPLAIELAAAWVPTLAPADILDRLDQRFRLLVSDTPSADARHRTLEAAIGWSYDLLDARAQTLFRRLSAFPGSFDAEAAEAVGSGGELRPEEILLILRYLVGHSMVQASSAAGRARFQMLESIRAYGEDRLAESGELAAVRDRLADWALSLAEWSIERLAGPQQASTLARLSAERPALRESLAWSLKSANGNRALRLSGALWRYWLSLSHIREGFEWLQESLAAAKDAPITDRAAALAGAGVLARQRGDFETAVPLLAQHLELRRELGQPREIAQAINSLSGALHASGESAEAITLLEEGLDLWRQIGDQRGEANTLSNLGVIASDRGDYRQAMVYGSRAIELREALGQPEGIAISLENLATAALRAGDHTAASQLFARAIERYYELGERDGIATCLEGMARICSASGDHLRGASLLGAAAAIRQAIDVAAMPADAAMLEDLRTRLRAALGPSAFESSCAQGAAMEIEEVVQLAVGRSTAALLARLTEREREAAELLATGASNKEIAAVLGISVRTAERHLYNVYRKIGARGRADAVVWAVEVFGRPST